MKTVKSLLEKLSLEKYYNAFRDNEIDADVLEELTDDDLREMGLPIGPRRKFLKAIAEMKTPQAVSGDRNNTRASDTQDASDAVRRQMTVLFCDLADSTAMSATMDPEFLSQLNRSYQQICTDSIQSLGGYVARYMGDGVLCYFGYPTAHEDDPVRAIRAAFSIRERCEELHCATESPMQVRFGIATGVVVVGETVGDGAARESTAVGTTPNLAARLQSVAKKGEIVVADETRQLAGDRYNFKPLQPLSLKGFEQSVSAWLVERENFGQSRFAAASVGGMTPFVGRKHERQLIEMCVGDAASGQGQAVLLCGEPGIGKSRLSQLAAGLAGDLAGLNLRVLQCSPHHTSSSLYPVIQHLLSVTGTDPEKAVAQARDILVMIGRSDESALALLELLLYGSTERELESSDPAVQKQQTLELLAEILLRPERPDFPLILVVEDLHWIDPSTESLVNALVESVQNRAVLILLTFRPEYSHAWVGSAHVHSLMLNRIRAEQCAEMVRSLVGTELADNVIEKICARADGIPLYVEEVAKAVDSAIQIPGSGVDASLVPATLADSLNARLDALGKARRSAQAAAVIGRDFSLELLTTIASEDSQWIADDVDTLVQSGLVYRLGQGEADVFRFKHALIQDAAYDSLLSERRTELHRQVAIALEQQLASGDRGADIVAHHYLRANDKASGTHYLYRAGAYSLKTMASEEALLHFELARKHGVIIENDDSDSLHPDMQKILMGLAATHRLLENYSQTLGVLAEAEALATGILDHKSLSEISTIRGNIYFALGERDNVLVAHTKASEYAELSGLPELVARSIGGLGDALYLRGDMREAAKQFARCCEIARNNGFHEIDASNRHMIGWSRLFELEFDEALGDAKEALALAEKHGVFRAEMLAHQLHAFVYAERLDIDRVRFHIRKSIEIGERIGSQNFVAFAMSVLARALDVESDEQEIRELAEASTQQVRSTPGFSFFGPSVLGALMLVTRDIDDRRAIVSEAEQSMAGNTVFHNCFWFYELAIISALHFKDWGQLELFQTSLRTLDSSNSRWIQFWIERSEIVAAIKRNEMNDSMEARRLALLAECDKLGMKRAARGLAAQS